MPGLVNHNIKMALQVMLDKVSRKTTLNFALSLLEAQG